MNISYVWVRENWLKLVAVVLVAGVLQPWYGLPYAYYQLMNWVVMGAAVMTAFQAKKLGKEYVMWLAALVAVVFNPIAPFYLQASAWQIADYAVIVLFLLSFFVMRKKNVA